ncbi:MAG: hypothetical protein ABEJ67_01820 [Halanaeroarchaeum sp.]
MGPLDYLGVLLVMLFAVSVVLAVYLGVVFGLYKLREGIGTVVSQVTA